MEVLWERWREEERIDLTFALAYGCSKKTWGWERNSPSKIYINPPKADAVFRACPIQNQLKDKQKKVNFSKAKSGYDVVLTHRGATLPERKAARVRTVKVKLKGRKNKAQNSNNDENHVGAELGDEPKPLPNSQRRSRVGPTSQTPSFHRTRRRHCFWLPEYPGLGRSLAPLLLGHEQPHSPPPISPTWRPRSFFRPRLFSLEGISLSLSLSEHLDFRTNGNQ